MTMHMLGISVYTELGRTGGPPPPKNWWDLDDILRVGLKSSKSDPSEYFDTVLSPRVHMGKKGAEDIKKQLKKFATEKSSNKPLDSTLQDAFFEALDLDLYAANVVGNNLVPDPKRKGGGNVTKLTDLKLTGSYAPAVEAARNCTNDGCKAYRTEIESLLKKLPDVIINAHKNTSEKLRKEYGQDVMPEKVKALARTHALHPFPKIELLFTKDKYKDDVRNHARHAEILSALLFEAGNIYTGSYSTKDENEQKKLEATVCVHNARQIIRIAREGHTITQTDWRNMMGVLFQTDVDITTFKFTEKARKAYENSTHDRSARDLNPFH